MFKFPKLYRVEVSPMIQGRIMENGKPLKGIKIQRRIYYAGKLPRIHTTRSNNNGEFTFKAYELASRRPGDLSHEQFIGLNIYAMIDTPPRTIFSVTLYDDLFFSSKLKTMLSQLNYDTYKPDLYLELKQSENIDSPTINVCTTCEWRDIDYTVLSH